MMRINEWNFYVRLDEVPDSGVFICQPTDSVLDAECWPIWMITMIEGVITHQEILYLADTGGYFITKMEGWTKSQLVEWVQFEEHTTGAEQTNNIMWVGDVAKPGPGPEPYWFCVDVCTPERAAFALYIMSYYSVRGTAFGDGDKAQFMVFDEETRAGDLVLAEMAFSAPGRLVWHQAKVCPICEDNGETICGHMYYDDCHEAAF